MSVIFLTLKTNLGKMTFFKFFFWKNIKLFLIFVYHHQPLKIIFVNKLYRQL